MMGGRRDAFAVQRSCGAPYNDAVALATYDMLRGRPEHSVRQLKRIRVSGAPRELFKGWHGAYLGVCAGALELERLEEAWPRTRREDVGRAAPLVTERRVKQKVVYDAKPPRFNRSACVAVVAGQRLGAGFCVIICSNAVVWAGEH